MKHLFYFTGYSDDVVATGQDEHTLDEHDHQGYYLMNNGAMVRAVQSPPDDPKHPGWKLTLERGEGVRIPAPDEEHLDARVPAWLDAPGYADVVILESDAPLEIVALTDHPRAPLSKVEMLAAKVARSINAEMVLDDDQRLPMTVVARALRAHAPFLEERLGA